MPLNIYIVDYRKLYFYVWILSSKQCLRPHSMSDQKYHHSVSSHKILLTHWCRVMHIYFTKLTITGSDNGLSPGQCRAIIWTNVGILLIEPLDKLQRNLNRNWHIFIQENPLENVVWKMAAILSRPQCVKSLSPGDAIWCRRTLLSLVQITGYHSVTIWTNDDHLYIAPLGIDVNEMLIKRR